MSIIVTEKWSGPGLTYASGGYRATRTFEVSGVGTKAAAIAAVVSFDISTKFNAKHPNSEWMYVDSQDAPEINQFTLWPVKISYSSSPAGRHPDPGNPLSEPTEYEFEWCSNTEGCDKDAFGKIIQNSAGQSFSSLVPTDVLSGWLIATRNEPFYDVANALAYSNAVNSAPVSFGPGSIWPLANGQACCRRIKPLSKITKDAPYARVQYAIELRGGYKLDSDGYWDGFKTRIENDGTVGWYNGTGGATKGPIIEVVGDNPQNVSFPVRLLPNGKPVQIAYKIGCPTEVSKNRYADPIANPTSLPTTTIIENAGDAYFIKQFPQTIKLLNLATLGLNT